MSSMELELLTNCTVSGPRFVLFLDGSEVTPSAMGSLSAMVAPSAVGARKWVGEVTKGRIRPLILPSLKEQLPEYGGRFSFRLCRFLIDLIDFKQLSLTLKELILLVVSPGRSAHCEEIMKAKRRESRGEVGFATSAENSLAKQTQTLVARSGRSIYFSA